MEEIIKKCNFYDKQVGCYKTFNGECNKENCQVYNLLQENAELKIYIESNKQQVEEVETLVMDNARLTQEVENLKYIIYYDVEKYKSALEEIKKICSEYPHIDDKGDYQAITGDTPVVKIYKINVIVNEVLGND